MTKTATTTVTETELFIAQGGAPDSYISDDEVIVECPTDYDPTLITAADIVNDPAITAIVDPAQRLSDLGYSVDWDEAGDDSAWVIFSGSDEDGWEHTGTANADLTEDQANEARRWAVTVVAR